MSLDVQQLEKVHELPSGVMQARCPACAESGGDRAGEHLRIYPYGRFGCCVHPGDRTQRKRIFALVGDKVPQSFTVRVAVRKSAAEPARSVATSLADFGRTLRTPVSESCSSEVKASQVSAGGECSTALTFRTLRTPASNPYTYTREENNIRCDVTHTYKEAKEGVLSVLAAEDWKRRHPNAPIDGNGRPLPYLGRNARLVIPFDSDARFHWWNGGQELEETIQAVKHGFRNAEGKEDNAIDV